MASDADEDPGGLRDRVESLENHVEGLTGRGTVDDEQGNEWTIADLMQLGLTRREAIVAIGAIASGASFVAGFKMATGTAAASGHSGNIGNADDLSRAYLSSMTGAGSPITVEDTLEFNGNDLGNVGSATIEETSTNVAAARADYLVVDDAGTYKAIDKTNNQVTIEAGNPEDAIENAAQNSSNKTVFVGPMSTTMSSTLQLSQSDLTLIGAGPRNTSLGATTGQTRVAEFSNCNNIHVSGIKFNANNNTDFDAVLLDNVQEFSFSKCEFVQGTRDGVLAITNIYRFHFSDCQFANNANRGFRSGDQGSVNEGVFTRCGFRKNGGDGWFDDNAQSVSGEWYVRQIAFNSCTFTNNNNGVVHRGARSVLHINCRYEFNTNNGIVLRQNTDDADKARNINIIGGAFNENGSHIRVREAVDFEISHSRLAAVGADVSVGIEIESSSSDINIGRGVNFDQSGSNDILTEIMDNGVRTRWNGIIGAGPLGGIDLTSVNGADDKEIAIANGTSTSASAGDLAVWDDGGPQWLIFNRDATE